MAPVHTHERTWGHQVPHSLKLDLSQSSLPLTLSSELNGPSCLRCSRGLILRSIARAGSCVNQGSSVRHTPKPTHPDGHHLISHTLRRNWLLIPVPFFESCLQSWQRILGTILKGGKLLSVSGFEPWKWPEVTQKAKWKVKRTLCGGHSSSPGAYSPPKSLPKAPTPPSEEAARPTVPLPFALSPTQSRRKDGTQ